MFPNFQVNKIEELMTKTESWEEVIELLMNPVEPSRGCKLISTYTAEKLQDSKEIKIKFKHQERWRNALKFYKISVASKDTKKLCVKSEDEPGIKQSA